MAKSIYDTDNDGTVDNADNLSGNDAAYYLNRDNHTGTQSADTLVDGTTNKAFTTSDKNRLDELTKVESSSVNGNILIDSTETPVYVHDISHPASMIVESSSRNFVSVTEKSTWNDKANKVLVPVEDNILIQSDTGDLVDSGKRFDDDGTTINDILSATKVITMVGTKEPVIDPGFTTQYYRGDKTWRVLNKTVVGLENVDNTSDANKPISNATQTALNDKINSSLIGIANGICPLDADTKVASIYLPSFVDDVEEYADLASFPLTGDSGKIYITLDTNKSYRWSGSTYVEISSSPGSTDEVTEGVTNLYFTTTRAANAAPVQSVAGRTGDVVVTKTDVGLSNVNNTSDVNKPVSTATQTALNGKEDSVTPGTTSQYYRGDKTWQTLTRNDVGLGSVDNTSDIDKPISTATQTALNGKEDTLTAGTTSQYYRGDKSWQTLDKNAVGLNNVNNTSDLNKPISTPTQTALNNKADKIPSGIDQGIVVADSTGNIQDSGKLFSDVSTTIDTIWSAAKIITELSDKEDSLATGTIAQYYRGDKSWQTLNKAAVGLGDVDNTSDVNKPISTATQTALDDKIETGLIGVANGICPLDADTKVASIYLPSFVDDVEEYADLASFPLTGATSKIYVTLDTNKTYRWSGSAYVEISSSPGSTDEVTEGVTNLYFTTTRAADAAPVQSVAGKTGVVTLVKADVGLTNVDNTSDVNKPVSSATQTALNAKENTIVAGSTSQYYRGDKTWQVLDKVAVGLTNVDNTSDVNKPVSSATQTALNLKENSVTPGTTAQYYRGDKTWQTLDKASVGLGNVDNTSDINKPISNATQTALNAKVSSTLVGAASGVCPLDATAKISSIYLPSFIDDVLEYANLASFPLVGDSGIIYVSQATNKTYRWSGSAYVEISAGPGSTDEVTEGVTNLYFTTTRASNAAPVQSVAGKTGTVTLVKADVGLGNVDNTSDLNKPISTATQTALNNKENSVVTGTSAQYYRGDKTWQTLNKAAVGLANVDNTSDANKPISTATQTALNAKEDTVTAGTIGQYYRGDKSWQTLDKTVIGLANVDNTSDANKPISTATQTALNAKENTVTSGTTSQYYRGDKTWTTLDKASVGLADVDNTSDIDKPISTDTQTALNAKENTVASGTVSQYYRGDKTWQTLTRNDVGLSNVDNTSDANKPISTATQTALNAKENTVTAGTVSQYYRGDKSWQTLDKAVIGLGSVDNTSDLDKPISDATQTALDDKEDILTAGTTSQYYRGDKTWQTLDKTTVGLSNVDNTSDANKPISTATQTALNAKENTVASGTIAQYYRGDKTWQTLDKSVVGLANVDNTSDANKPISTATQTALNTKATKIVGGTTGNLVTRDASGDIADSGKAVNDSGTTINDIWSASKIALSLDDKEDILTAGTTSQYYRGDKTWQTLDKAAVGLGNVDNTSDANKPISTATQTALNAKINTSTIGAASGVCPLDATSKIASIYLPSFVDDVLEYANLAAFPVSGIAGVIYVSQATNKTYRWSGSAYVEISASPGSTDEVAEGVSNLYFTTTRAANAAPVQSVAGKTGIVTLVKADVGLGNVDNTSDANKPVSTATQTALNAKENTVASGTVAQYYRGDKSWQTLDKAAVGLGNVDNTSDANKPVSTATQTALNAKENTVASGTTSQYYRGDKTWNTLDKTAVGLANVDNTSDANKPVSTATQTALNAKENTVAAGTNLQYYRGDKTWQTLNKAAVGLTNVDNTSDANKPVSTATQTALNAKENTVAAGTISQYYRGDKSWQTLDKTAVGLGNVDNTSDANKPISTATQTALNAKEDTVTAGTIGQYYRGDKTWTTLDKTAVGLANVDNTSDANKPISTATQTALNAKENTVTAGTIGQYYRGDKTWQVLDKAAVGLGNVDNTSDLNKPISTATQDALDLKANSNNPVFTGVTTMGTGGMTTLLVGVPDIPVIPGMSTMSQWNDNNGAFSDWVYNVAGNGYPVVNFVSTGGTLLAPATSGATGAYGSVRAWGYSDAFKETAKMVFEKDGTPSATSLPSKIVFYTTPVGTTVPVARVTIDNAGNVTGITKAMVGLGNADDTSDANKPVSTATQTALNLKENTVTAGTTAQYYRGDKTWQTLNKAAVGLGNVDNTSDANKPVSTATQTALNLKADKIVGGTSGNIVTRDVNGNITDSGKAFNDAGTTANDILSAAQIATRYPLISSLTKVSAYLSANQVITNNTWTKANINTETKDTLNEFNTTTSRFTASHTARYLIDAMITFGYSNNTSTVRSLVLYINGAASNYRFQKDSNIRSSSDDDLAINCAIDLTAGDYIEVYVFHNRGSNINLLANRTRFNATEMP
jgi:hypothetical protein